MVRTKNVDEQLNDSSNKLTGRALLVEWELFCSNPKASGKKLHRDTGYISANGKITPKDTREFNQALAQAKEEEREFNEKNTLNKTQKLIPNNPKFKEKIIYKSSSNANYPRKRTTNIRPRLRGKELLDYLEKKNFYSKNSDKDFKRFLVETGYSIPYQKLTDKQTHAFFMELFRAEDEKNGKKQTTPKFDINYESLQKQNKTHIFYTRENIKDEYPQNKKTSIYLIREGKNGSTKIGISNNVKKRMTSLVNQYHVWPLELIASAPLSTRWEAERFEQTFHKKYSAYKSYAFASPGGHTSSEWFNLNKDQIKGLKTWLDYVSKKKIYIARFIERADNSSFFSKPIIKFYGEDGLPLHKDFPIYQFREMNLWVSKQYYEAEWQKNHQNFPLTIEPLTSSSRLSISKTFNEQKNMPKQINIFDSGNLVLFFFFILPTILAAIALWPITLLILVVYFLTKNKN